MSAATQLTNPANESGFLRSFCPVCKTEDLVTLHNFVAAEVAEYFFPRRRDEARHVRLRHNIENLWQQTTCIIYQCTACRFAFPVPYVGGDRDFYELAYGDPSYPDERWEYFRAIELLKTLGGSDSLRILELGAGKGQFIKLLLSAIPRLAPSQIFATDYSSHSVAALRALGVCAELASVFDLAALPGNRAAFSAVCAFQSIEHMAEAVEVIQALCQMVQPGGLIIFSVPNGEAIEFNERQLDCFDLPPNHVGRWYRTSFEALARRVGLRLIAHETEPKRLRQLLRDTIELRVRGVAGLHPRSLSGRVRAVKHGGIRKILSAAVGAASLLPRLPKIWRLETGYAQMAVLQVPHSE